MEVDFNSSSSEHEPSPSATGTGTSSDVNRGNCHPSTSRRSSSNATPANAANPSLHKVEDNGTVKGKLNQTKAIRSKENKEKKGDGKKVKKTKKNGSTASKEGSWSGPSLNSLLGIMSSDDEGDAAATATAPPPTNKSSLASLKDMPPLF